MRGSVGGGVGPCGWTRTPPVGACATFDRPTASATLRPSLSSSQRRPPGPGARPAEGRGRAPGGGRPGLRPGQPTRVRGGRRCSGRRSGGPGAGGRGGDPPGARPAGCGGCGRDVCPPGTRPGGAARRRPQAARRALEVAGAGGAGGVVARARRRPLAPQPTLSRISHLFQASWRRWPRSWTRPAWPLRVRARAQWTRPWT